MKKLLLLFFLMTVSFGQLGAATIPFPSAVPSLPAAPTPSARNSWDVVSLYSDSFTNVASTWHPSWGQTTIASQESLSGNPAEKLTNFGYEGFTTGAQNLTSMTSVHFDVYSVNETSIKIYLLIGGEPMVLKSLTTGQWNSFDIPMSDFGTGSKAAATGFKFESGTYSWPNGVSTVYLDNIYFYRPATSQPATLGALTVPAKLAGAAPFVLTPPTTNSAGAITYTSSNLAVATISGSTVTVVGAGTSTITATQAATSSYTSASTSADLVVSYPPPTVAATTPPARNSSNVISIFSGAYTDISGTDFFPNWGQSTVVSDYTVAGNAMKKYSNLNYQGTNLGPIDVSLMTNLHLDVWTPDCTSFQVFLIGGGENSVTLTPTLSGWNSFNIPMSSYSARTLTSIAQFKFVGTNGSTVYLDNIYFWKPEGSPTITGFSIPSKVIGGTAFSLVAPTSNSTGTFSYTSSNTSVATISGSTVTIVGIGTSTITATQAAAGGFGSGFVTADLIITPPAAPTPTVASSHVVSLFSDPYTNVAATNWNPNWGQSTQVSDLSIGGNNTKKYSNLNYQGVQLNSPIDVSAMQTLHIDIWTPDCTTFSVFLINQPSTEKSVALTPTLSGWNSFDIDLPLFTGAGGVNLANIGQLKFTGNGTVYVDNVYFSDVFVAHAPSITLSNTTKLIGDANFTLSASSASAGAMTYSSSNSSVATISGATVTIVGVGTTTITVNQAANGNYLVGSTTATLTVNSSTPTTAAPIPPTRNAWDVVSFFSDAYAAQTGTDWNPNWGQGTVPTNETIAGNATKLLSNFDYQGILTASTNVYSMTNLHIDVWTPNCNSFQVYLIANGENAVTLTPTLSGWNSFDIPMSSYSARNLLALNGFKLEAPQRGAPKVYYDNLYFWRAATTQPPTIGSFTVPAKVLGNGAFNLTAPTSNSLGTFTYSSSNTNVATIVGRTVTIVGVGTSVITATQAANGGYATGSAFASLVVSYPIPTYAPASPTKDSSRVISIFSDAYTNVAGTAFFQQWGSGTAGSTIQIGGNNIQKYENFSYVGTQFASPIDASSMEMLHLDIWTPDCTSFKVSLISNGENAVTLTPTLSGWNSFDIDLSLYSVAGRNLASISQFKFERDGSGTKTVYLDNIYFYNNKTKVQASQAGATLATINSPVFADWVLPYVTNYRFKVVANGVTEIIETTNRWFYLKSLTGGALYNTTYTVSVAIKYNGTWRNYGAECIVTSPMVPTTKVQTSQCGTTLATINSPVFADWVLPYVTKYRFKVVANGVTEIIETANRWFYLTSLTGGALYNTTYTVSVAMEYNGTWGNYGAECIVTSPMVPTTKVQTSQCGTTLATLNSPVFADWVLPYVTKYRFKVVANGVTEIIETTNRWFYLKSLIGGALYNKTYTVSVAMEYNGVYGNYGDECTVYTPSNLPTQTKLNATLTNEVSVKVYPNPFTANFKLDFSSSSESNVEVVVYDMIGRQLEKLQVISSEMNNLELGNNYPSGVYNVIVTQEQVVKTLRVIKR